MALSIIAETNLLLGLIIVSPLCRFGLIRFDHKLLRFLVLQFSHCWLRIASLQELSKVRLIIMYLKELDTKIVTLTDS